MVDYGVVIHGNVQMNNKQKTLVPIIGANVLILS